MSPLDPNQRIGPPCCKKCGCYHYPPCRQGGCAEELKRIVQGEAMSRISPEKAVWNELAAGMGFGERYATRTAKDLAGDEELALGVIRRHMQQAVLAENRACEEIANKTATSPRGGHAVCTRCRTAVAGAIAARRGE